METGIDIIIDRDGNPIEEIAKDGRPFDQDLNHGDPRNPDEVEVIQYVVTSGRRRRVLIKVSSMAIADKAEDLILTCEIAPITGNVVITGRRMNEGPECDIEDIAENVAGERSVPNVLESIIKKLHPD